MPKTRQAVTFLRTLTVVLAFVALQVQAEPPPGSPYSQYSQGPGQPPQGPPPYKLKSAGPSKIFGWLGSQMNKLTGYTPKPRFPPGFPKYKPQPGMPNYQAVVLPSPYGGNGGPEQVKIMGPTYTSYSPNSIHEAGKEYFIPGQGSPSGPTTVIYQTTSSYDGGFPSSLYSSPSYASPSYPSPSYKSDPSYQAGPSYQGAGPSYQAASPSYQAAGPSYQSAPSYHQQGPGPSFQKPSVKPVPYSPQSYAQPQQQIYSSPSDISYRQPPQQFYSSAPPQFFPRQQQRDQNLDILQSKLVSYEKETFNPGSPGYNQVLVNPVGAHATPQVHYVKDQGQAMSYIINPNQFQGPAGQKRFDDLTRITTFQDSSPQVSPIYDLGNVDMATLAKAHSSGGRGQGKQRGGSPQTVSLDAILGQQQQQRGQGQVQYEFVDPAQSQQGAYSQQSFVSVAPPQGFNYAHQQQEQFIDQAVSESNNQGVQILSHGAQDGNPVFEVIADANAPMYEGGHPFDVNQLISMIEPGAQVDAKDIVAEAQSENQETYVQPPEQAQGQGLGPIQFQIQDAQQSSDFQRQPQMYTMVQKGNSQTSQNSRRNPISISQHFASNSHRNPIPVSQNSQSKTQNIPDSSPQNSASQNIPSSNSQNLASNSQNNPNPIPQKSLSQNNPSSISQNPASQNKPQSFSQNYIPSRRPSQNIPKPPSENEKQYIWTNNDKTILQNDNTNPNLFPQSQNPASPFLNSDNVKQYIWTSNDKPVPVVKNDNDNKPDLSPPTSLQRPVVAATMPEAVVDGDRDLPLAYDYDQTSLHIEPTPWNPMYHPDQNNNPLVTLPIENPDLETLQTQQTTPLYQRIRGVVIPQNADPFLPPSYQATTKSPYRLTTVQTFQAVNTPSVAVRPSIIDSIPQQQQPLSPVSSNIMTTRKPKRKRVKFASKRVQVTRMPTDFPETYGPTFDPILHGEIEVDQPGIIYHTVKPSISRNNVNRTSSSINGRYPNHKDFYNKSPEYPSVIHGIQEAATVNPLFDKVSYDRDFVVADMIRSDHQDDPTITIEGSSGSRNWNTGTDVYGQGSDFIDTIDSSSSNREAYYDDPAAVAAGDLAYADSRQVKSYAITVTPPSNLITYRNSSSNTSSSSKSQARNMQSTTNILKAKNSISRLTSSTTDSSTIFTSTATTTRNILQVDAKITTKISPVFKGTKGY